MEPEKGEAAAATVEETGEVAAEDGMGTTAAAEEEVAAVKMITLKSSEGAELEVSEAAARLSGLFRGFINEGLADDIIAVPNVGAEPLATVIKYCTKHAEVAAKPDPEDLEEWDRELLDGLDQAALYALIIAANFLDIQGLLDAICRKVADMMKGKTTAQIRKTFNIVSDFTAEEEEEIRNEYIWAFDDVADDDGDDD
ncbi:hypothetical protein ACP70R_004775 [Stipagrostis hirtigluma subsp. patula]